MVLRQKRRPEAGTGRDRPSSIDHTVGMTTAGGGLAVGGDVEQALIGIPVPSYVLDTK